MLPVVLDTNAVHRDPWLTRDDAPKLVQLAACGACEIVYPRVVIRELTRQRIESAREAHGAAAHGVTQMGLAGIDIAQTSSLLEKAHDRIEADIDDAFVAMLAKTGIRSVPVPDVKTTDLLDRDLGRRRPFLEIEHNKKMKSLGFRDVLIWESVLKLLEASEPEDTVVFVTFDVGFIAEDRKSLHVDLLEDLDQRGIPRERVRLARGIPEAISLVEEFLTDTAADTTAGATAEDLFGEESLPLVEPTVPDEPTPSTEEPADPERSQPPVEIAVHELKRMSFAVPHSSLVRAATDALYDLVNEDISEQLSYGGDHQYPSFVKFTVPIPEGGTITGIDQTKEFSFEESEQSPDVLVGTAEAVITLEGALYRGDWFIGEGSVSITGQINDHYLDASAEVEVKVVVEINIEESGADVLGIVLEDVPALPRSSDDIPLFDIADDEGHEGAPDES